MWPDQRRPWYGSFVFSQAESLRAAGVELDVVYIPGYLGKGEYLRGAAAVRRAVTRGRYDVVHAHYGHSGVIGRLQAGAPLIISYCGDDLLGTPRSDRSGRFDRSSLLLARGFAQLARTAAATITKSEAMASRLPRRCRTRNHVIPNGVDLTTFAPIGVGEARRRLDWSADRPNVLFVGNPDIPRKNLPLAEAVCAELAGRGRPVELRVAWGIAPGEVPVWMNAADVLLFPSLSEGSPNTVKEAMAVELPIVTAPVGDAPERLEGVPGTFVVDHNVQAMADAVIAALAAGRAPAAREAVKHLSIEHVAQRVISVYRGTIG